MRKWLVIGGTLVLLIAAFAAFMWSQRHVRVGVASEKPEAATRSASGTQMGSIGRTESAWVMTYDKSSGLPQARFRGEQFTPQKGDQVLVDRPQVEFFIGKDRSEVVRIVGKTGLVIIPGEGPRIRSDFSSTPAQAPSRGEMRDVTVTYFPSQEAANANQSQITLTLNNAYFDNELYEIATEDYIDENGKKVDGKDVPVIVRGDNFEFSGKGLQIRWDERSQRLKSLVVYSGDHLTIQRPAEGLRRQTTALPLPLMFAATDSKQAIEAAAAQKAAILEHLYRATFHDRVTVTQKDQTLASAPLMHVDFLDRASSGQTLPDAKAATPAKRTTSGATPKAQSPQAKPRAATGPSQDPLGVNADEPVVIRWGGQMTVAPGPDEALKPESGNDTVVRLAGTADDPVHLYGNGGEIVASIAAYQTDKEFAWIEGSSGSPVRMTDAKGSVLLTPQLRYSQPEARAVLRGPSSALVKTQQDGKEEQLKATWRDLAEATFADNGTARSISNLVLRGEVKVEHPRLKQFNAGNLAIDFDQAAGAKQDTSSQVKQITASDHVACVIADEKNELQSIRAENLKLAMGKDEKGTSYPARVDAAGSVVAGTDLQQIQADAIQADLKAPREKQNAESRASGPELAGLDHMVATGHVKLTSAKGETVSGDRLQVRQSKDKASWVVLEGAPAVVSQKGGSLSGPFIEVDTATEKAIVTGGGRLVAADAKMAGGGKGQPVEITWTGDGSVDGASNLARVAGNVLVKYVDSDGTMNEAAGDRVDIDLGTKAQTQEKKPPSEFGFMSNRYPKKLTLLPSEGKEVRVQSLLPGPGGTILRQVNLFGPQLVCYMDEDGVQRMEVPAQQDRPGRLLYIDLPIATRKPVANADPFKTRELPGSTAFAWHEMLTYEKAKQQLTMSGGVMVRHEPQMPGAKKFQVDAERIVAELVDKKKPSTASSAEAVDLRKLTLMGSPVHLVREDIDLTAPLIEIDPTRKSVTARGSGQSPVDVDRGRMVGSFEWVEINSESSEMRFGRAMGGGRQ